MADNEGSERKSGKLAWKNACAEGKAKKIVAQAPSTPQRKPTTKTNPLTEGPASSVTYKKNPVPVESDQARIGLIPESVVSRSQATVSPSTPNKALKIVKWTMLVLGIAAIGVGANGIVYSYIAKKERAEKIVKMAAEFKRCRVTPLPKGCLDEQKKRILEESAIKLTLSGEYREAGLIYIELDKNDKAKDMIDKCRSGDTLPGGEIKNRDLHGAEMIEEALRVRGYAQRDSIR